MNVEIHEERLEDIAAIREINRNAFGQDHFMLLVFDQSKIKGVSGQAKYRKEFSAVS